jgi:hypothetical protein
MRVGAYWGVSAPFFSDFDNDGKGDIVALGGLEYPGPPGVTSTLMFIKGLNTGSTSVSYDATQTPNGYVLGQNYPNPFNPSTTIQFTLPAQTSVKLELFNTLGQRVGLLLDEVRGAGHYSERVDASQLASGVYFYKFQAGSFVGTKKMLLLK